MTATLIAPPPVDVAGLNHLRQLTGRYDGPSDVAGEIELAKFYALADEAVPHMYRGKPGNVLALMYQAKALDVALATAIQQVFYDDGKSGMSGSLMLALMMRAGHVVKVVHHDDKVCEMTLTRCDQQPGGTAKWTLAEAARAGLTTREMWRSYPSDMLYWRTVSRLARQFAADVVQGFGYTPDELRDSVDQRAATVDEDRPVSDRVQAFLANLDTADYPTARAMWRKAQASDLGDEYAGVVRGRSWTVGQLLAATCERLRPDDHDAPAAPPAVGPDDVAALPAGEGTLPCGCDTATVITTGEHPPTCALLAGDGRTAAEPVDEAPATEMAAEPVVDDAPPWAVDADTDADPGAADPPTDDLADVVASANATLARLGIPTQPAADEPAPPTAGPDDGDVLVLLLPCGCNPHGVTVNGHRRNCHLRVAVVGVQ